MEVFLLFFYYELSSTLLWKFSLNCCNFKAIPFSLLTPFLFVSFIPVELTSLPLKLFLLLLKGTCFVFITVNKVRDLTNYSTYCRLDRTEKQGFLITLLRIEENILPLFCFFLLFLPRGIHFVVIVFLFCTYLNNF